MLRSSHGRKFSDIGAAHERGGGEPSFSGGG